MCGQSVHERLVRMGVARKNPPFSEADVARLRAEYDGYARAGRLAVLAAEMGRTRQFLCRQARSLGLTDPGRGKPWVMDRKQTDPKGLTTFRKWRKRSLTVGKQTATFRSHWEANYARYLQWRLERGDIAAWEYEPETLWLASGRSYLPDFRVTLVDGSSEIHEVKGYMDARSCAKVAEMREVGRFVLIDTRAYRALAASYASEVPGWEPDPYLARTRKGRARAMAAPLL